MLELERMGGDNYRLMCAAIFITLQPSQRQKNGELVDCVAWLVEMEEMHAQQVEQQQH